MTYHNLNGPSPTLLELVAFFMRHETHVEIRKGALPGTATALAPSYTPDRDQALLAALIATGWAFQHMTMVTGQRKGVFQVLVRMEDSGLYNPRR